MNSRSMLLTLLDHLEDADEEVLDGVNVQQMGHTAIASDGDRELEGKVAHVLDDPNCPNHGEEVLKFL